MRDDVLARLELREIAERYFWAVDRRDWAALEACFTADVHYDLFGGKETMRSAAEVVSRLKGVLQFKATHHAWANGQFQVDGSRGTGVIHAIAYCVRAESDGLGVLVRGLRYEDIYARDPTGDWQIVRRTHVPMWQFEAQGIGEELMEQQRLQRDAGR